MNGLRVNPTASYVLEDGTCTNNLYDHRDKWEANSIVEVDALVVTPPPEYEAHPDWYTVSEEWETGKATYSRKSDVQIAELERGKALGQIRSIEGTYDNDMRKLTRIFILDMMEFMAAQQGITPAQLYQVNKGYRGMKDLEEQIKPLRAKV